MSKGDVGHVARGDNMYKAYNITATKKEAMMILTEGGFEG